MRDSHRLFLQTFMSQGMLGKEDVQEAFREACTRFGEQALLDKTRFVENLVEFIRVINVNIRDLHLEIRRAVDEFTGDYYYVLVSNLDSAVAKLSPEFTNEELDLFKKLLESICTSDSGTVSSSDALNLTDQSDKQKRLSKADAEKFFTRLEREKWLMKQPRGRYYLSARTVAEFEPYILDQFAVAKCNMCQKLCVQGQRCDMCSTPLHFSCATKLFANKPAPRCPHHNCSAPWPVQRSSQSSTGADDSIMAADVNALPPSSMQTRKRRR